jgi:uncharacterized protein GlcG (DUF336 family)
VAAAEVEVKSRGLGMVIVVVDDTGNIIELARKDTAQVASVNVGIGKARTAAIYPRDRLRRTATSTRARPTPLPWRGWMTAMLLSSAIPSTRGFSSCG